MKAIKKHSKSSNKIIAQALLSIPAVSAALVSTFGNPDKLNRAALLAGTLKRMVLSEQTIPEVKGWVNLKTKKTFKTKSQRPYHVEMIVKRPSAFGITEKAIKNELVKKYDAMDAPNPDEAAEKAYEQIKSGTIDVEHLIEVLAMKKGWVRVVGGRYSEISGLKKDMNDKNHTLVLNMMEDNGFIPFGAKGVGVIDIGTYVPPSRASYEANVVFSDGLKGNEITNLLSGKPRGAKQTEIGATMARFRV